MLLLAILLAVALLSVNSTANTEKTIFVAPPDVYFGDERPNLVDLQLETLSPDRLALRTSLPVAFPTTSNLRGLESWFLLSNLNQGQRYELRVCWPATQPTQFWLETYTVTQVLEEVSLLQNLSAYEETRQNSLIAEGQGAFETGPIPPSSHSALFLRLWSAADYFTTQEHLMLEPPPVHVDIILDPYIFNVFPQSLLSTAAYIILVAISGWFLSGIVWNKLRVFALTKEHDD